MLTALFAMAFAADRYTSESTPFLHKPFEGEHPTSGLYDHRKPPKDNDHRQLTAWGSLTWGRAGHAAYDWPMKIGTPVLAAADGVVTLAKDMGPQKCGAKTVPNDLRVRIRHQVGERTFYTGYLHVSELLVQEGQAIEAGDPIARSGNSGCSSGPHLHFVVLEDVGLDRPRTVDPYGWDSNRPDPTGRLRYRHAEWLWLEGQAPLLFRVMGRSQDQAWGDVRISNLRGMGWQDGRYPNNEFVQLSIRKGGPKRVDLTGWSLRNRAGREYAFPEGTRVVRGRPLRLYSGDGADTDDTLFWGGPHEVWSDEGDCVELIDRRGDVVHTHSQGRRADTWCAPR